MTNKKIIQFFASISLLIGFLFGVFAFANRLLFVHYTVTVWETLVVVGLFAFCLLITKTLLRAFWLCVSLYSCFFLINCIKIYFLFDPVTFADIFLIREMIAVTSWLPLVLGGTGCVLFLLIFYRLIEFRKKKMNFLFAFIFLIFLNISFKNFFLQDVFSYFNPTLWSVQLSSEKIGPLTYIWLHGLQYDLNTDTPQLKEVKFSSEFIQRQHQEFQNPATDLIQKPQLEKPNIYIVLVESLWDPTQILSQQNFPDPFAPEFRNLLKQQGNYKAIIPQIGGGTPRSEFEILCGLPNFDWSILFKHHFNSKVDCLPNELRHLGYKTFAFHNGARLMWNRDRAYPSVGIETYLSNNDLDKIQSPDQVNDSDPRFLSTGFNFIKENNLKSKNNFYFLLTIGLHFPFSETPESSTKQFESIPDPDLKRYFYLVRSTTRSLFEFVEKIKSIDPKGIIVIAGDHLPHTINSLLKPYRQTALDTVELEKVETPLLLINLPQVNKAEIQLPHLAFLIYRQLNQPLFHSASDFFWAPNIGLSLYPYRIDSENHKLANCSENESYECLQFWQNKKAFEILAKDSIWGNQLIRSIKPN